MKGCFINSLCIKHTIRTYLSALHIFPLQTHLDNGSIFSLVYQCGVLGIFLHFGNSTLWLYLRYKLRVKYSKELLGAWEQSIGFARFCESRISSHINVVGGNELQVGKMISNWFDIYFLSFIVIIVKLKQRKVQISLKIILI